MLFLLAFRAFGGVKNSIWLKLKFQSLCLPSYRLPGGFIDLGLERPLGRLEFWSFTHSIFSNFLNTCNVPGSVPGVGHIVG